MAFLELRDVHKRYGGVVALRGASLSAEAGEVHALLGANGSGKSTLNKVLTGVVAPDAAEVLLGGEALRIGRPQDAYAHGVAAVYQELSLVPDLTVAANIGLAVEATRAGFLRRRAIRDRAAQVLERFRDAFAGQRLPIDRPVRALSPGEQQIVEIAKALARQPKVLVLDEATASLYRAQVDVLFEVVRELRDEGVLVLLTSHRMGEIFEVGDRATVLRNGETAGDVVLAESDESELIELMIGRHELAAEVAAEVAASEEVARAPETRPVVLDVADLRTDRVHGVSLELHEGEVLGLGGLQGQGQSDLLAALFGAVRRRGGQVRLEGRPLRLNRPSQAVSEGFAFVPGDRGREGLFAVRPILENLTVPSLRARAVKGVGALSQRRESEAARGAVERMRIKLGSLDDPVSTLSGGNQQKVVVGKWLVVQPRVVLLDDPTKGIDVGAKEELYEVIARLTAHGVSVLLNSSDDEELLGLSDRVLVLFEGRIVAELTGDERTRERLVSASLNVEQEEAS